MEIEGWARSATARNSNWEEPMISAKFSNILVAVLIVVFMLGAVATNASAAGPKVILGKATGDTCPGPFVTVDQKANVSFHPERWMGAEDLSFRYAVALKNLSTVVVCVEVTDNVFVSPLLTSDANAIRFDHVELWFKVTLMTRAGFAPSGEPIIGESTTAVQLGLFPPTPSGTIRARGVVWDRKPLGEEAGLPTVLRVIGDSNSKGWSVRAEIDMSDLMTCGNCPDITISGLTIGISDSDVPVTPKQEKMMVSAPGFNPKNGTTYNETNYMEATTP